MASITLNIADADILRGLYAQLGAQAAGGFKSARLGMGEYMVRRVIERLHSGNLVSGAAMPQSKAAAARGGKTLLDRGHLRDSYGYQLVDDGVQAYGGAGGAGKYAAAHHFGRPAWVARAKGKALNIGGAGKFFRKSAKIPALPARPVLGANRVDKEQLGEIFLASIRRNLGGGAQGAFA